MIHHWRGRIAGRMRASASIRRVSKETQEARRQTIFCVYEVNEYGEMAEWFGCEQVQASEGFQKKPRKHEGKQFFVFTK